MKAGESCLAILGAGNIGRAIARGVAGAGLFAKQNIILTRRKTESVADLAAEGYQGTSRNVEAVRAADIIVIAVTPQHLDSLLSEIRTEISADRHTVVSVVSGATIAEIREHLGVDATIVRAMPNTA